MISITIDAVGILAGNWHWFTLSSIVSVILWFFAYVSFLGGDVERDPRYGWAWRHAKWSEKEQRLIPATPPTNYFGHIVFFPAMASSFVSPFLAAAGILVAIWLTIFG